MKEALVVLIQQNLARAVMPTAQELQRVHPRTFLYYEVRAFFEWTGCRSAGHVLAYLESLAHNLISSTKPTGQVDLDAVTLRLRFPKFLLRARELFGREVRACH